MKCKLRLLLIKPNPYMQKINLSIFLKKPLYLIAAAIVAIGLIGYGGYHWWTGTPEYSLSQLRNAVQRHDVDTAFRYIDYDKVFEGFWEDVSAKAMADTVSSTSSDDGFEAMGNMLGASFLQAMKPAMKGAFRTGLEGAIKGENSSTETATSSREFADKLKANTFKVRRDGSDASVDLGNGVSLILAQTPNRYWKIVSIKGLDTATTTATP